MTCANEVTIGTLQIGGIRIRVDLCDLEPGTLGQYLPIDLTIQIQRGQAPDQFVSTLAHEMLHATWSMLLYGTQPSEEAVAQAIGATFAANYTKLPSILRRGAADQK